MSKKRKTPDAWLVKSEPGTWSWDDQVKAGKAEWDGVRNHQAANNMKAMAVGDWVLFYHSVNEKQVVGLTRVAETYQPDPTDASGRFGMVYLEAVKPFTRPVTLAEIKADPVLAELALVKQSRLSVMPIPGPAFARLLELGETRL